MRSILKGLAVVVAIVLSNTAFAQEAEAAGPDCVMTSVKVTSGVPEYSGNPGSVYAQPGASVVSHFECRDGTAGGITTSTGGVSKDAISPASGSSQTITLPSGQRIEFKTKKFAESIDFRYTVPTNAQVGSSIPIAFSDGTTLNVIVGDSFIRGRQYSADWQNQHARDAGQDQAIADAASGRGGHFLFQLGGGVAPQTSGNSPDGGGALMAGWHFGNPSQIGFMLAGQFSYFGGNIDNRGVVGIPTTAPTVLQSKFDLGALALADIVVADGVVHIPLGGGLFVRQLYVPDATIGNDPVTQRQYFDPELSEWTGGIKLHLGINFALTPGVFLGLAVQPTLPFTRTYLTHGGQEVHYNAEFPILLTLGFSPGSKPSYSAGPPSDDGPQGQPPPPPPQARNYSSPFAPTRANLGEM